MKRTYMSEVWYSMSETLVGPRHMYRSETSYLVPAWEPLDRRIRLILAPSFPAWTAQDIYDDAHGLPRLTEMKV